MSALFLILSGTYVGPELVSEFGRLPPCFLPNGTRRLLDAQVEFGRTLAANLALTLPDGFDEPRADADRFASAGLRVFRTDPRNSISASLFDVLETVDHRGRLFLLFGDTLIRYPSAGSEPDTFATGETHHLAMWADYNEEAGRVRFHQRVDAGGNPTQVVAGFFDFADTALLRTLAAAHHDFIDLLNAYAGKRDFRPARTTQWLDFGHLHTYFHSRRSELASRSFNQVTGGRLSVRKSGTPDRKIFAEASWYRNLPNRFRPYVPHFIELHRTPAVAYEIEYLYLPLLSELYCFGRLPTHLWVDILTSCREFLELCQETRPDSFEIGTDYPKRFFTDMIVGKTFGRLRTFANSAGLSLDEPWSFGNEQMPSLNRLAEALIGLIRPTGPGDICTWHGDFHFANIFYDFRSQRVRVVDPRGMLSDGTLTMFGDARYDVAKLSHSVVGMYDLLIAGRYALTYDGGYAIDLAFESDPEREGFLAEYARIRIGGYSCADPEITAMASLLFLSMLPLHANNKERQFAMLANGLRLALLAGADR